MHGAHPGTQTYKPAKESKMNPNPESNWQPNRPAVSELLSSIHSANRAQEIRQLVSQECGVEDLRGTAMWLTRRLTNLSLPTIGKQYGQHHGTVLHACRSVERQAEEIPELKDLLDRLLLKLA